LLARFIVFPPNEDPASSMKEGKRGVYLNGRPGTHSEPQTLKRDYVEGLRGTSETVPFHGTSRLECLR
jgi:hypothetical protein